MSSRLLDERGRAVRPSASTYVLNGGPELVDGGQQHATPRADGMVHPGDPSFYYSAPKGGMLWVFAIDGKVDEGDYYNAQVNEKMLPTYKP